MVRLIIKADDRYIKHMFEHLRKEHPSTKRKMHIIGLKGGLIK